MSMVEFNPQRYQLADIESGVSQELQVTRLLHDEVRRELELKGTNKQLLNSAKESQWAKIDGGRMVLEVRTLSFLQQPTYGSVNVFDLDDCLFSATSWHAREFQLLEENEALREQGINITVQRAKEIYELSKIRIPQFAEKEPRYTPRFNLILLSLYAEALRDSQIKENPEEDAWIELLKWRELISKQTEEQGERALRAYAVNPTVQSIFENNPTSEFVYSEFAEDFLTSTGKSDIRIIATRGKIEGPLGQVYKLHSSGLMQLKSITGGVIDLVIYSNDIKSEALITIMKILPGIHGRQIRVFDDNPAEIMPYLEVARNLGAPNIEVVQISHPDAKRKDFNPGIESTHEYSRYNTYFKHFSWRHTAVSA